MFSQNTPVSLFNHSTLNHPTSRPDTTPQTMVDIPSALNLTPPQKLEDNPRKADYTAVATSAD
jgi:hypothetical protein